MVSVNIVRSLAIVHITFAYFNIIASEMTIVTYSRFMKGNIKGKDI